MGVLTATTRHQLLDLLCALPLLDSRSGRDILLHDLPLAVRTDIPRSETTRLDLDAIVATCDAWWPPDGPVRDYPLRQLITAALDLAAGTATGAALQDLLAALPEVLDARARPACPYPGMMPFRPEDARFFYGRQPEIAELVRRLRYGRFLLVIGPSGSGKSSLVMAGLLPALARQQAGTWHVVTLRPGATPAAELARALGGDPTAPAATGALLAAHPPATRLLVLIDQLEEVFTQGSREGQAAFWAALAGLRAVSAATTVLTLRADFYPDLMSSPLWPPGEGERLEIAPLRGDALRAAITRPAAELGVAVEPALVERLLADAADEPGSLPLLQEALVLLWEGMAGRTLALAGYLALGQDGRSGLAVALATKADATYNALTQEQQRVARRILLRLIAFNEGRPDTRRQQPVAALQVPGEDPALFGGTLAALTDHRLLTTSGEEGAAGARRVDISHEALIRGWPLLQGWIAERRTAEQVRRRLEDKAAEWVRLGRGGGLLDAAELPEAERWLGSADAEELGASADLRDLVTASRTALEAEAQEREAARQHELAQAQALAAAQRQRAEEQARANRRLRQSAMGLGLLLIVALAASGLAFLQTQTATQAQATAQSQATQAVAARVTAEVGGRVARAQALAANAVAQLDADPELSVLLAVEAVSTTRRLGEPIVAQAEDALHRALLASHVRVTVPGLPPIVPGTVRYVMRAAWSPDGRFFVTVSGDRGHIWEAATGKERTVLRSAPTNLTTVRWSPDGRFILTAASDKSARIWDAATGQLRTTLQGHTDWVNDTAWSPDGRFVVTASQDQTAKVWDAATGQERATLRGHTDALKQAEFSPDGRRLVTMGYGEVRIWDAATGALQVTLHPDERTVFGAAWSRDSRSIVTADGDGTAKIWNADTGALRLTLEGHTSAVTSAAWSPDGTALLTASVDGTAKIWDATTGQEGMTLRGHSQQVWSAQWSPDGRSIVTASADYTARIWDAATGQLDSVLRGHSGSVDSAVWNPEGGFVLTTDADGAARIWDVAPGHEGSSLEGHEAGINAVAWSPDGRSIVTSSSDSTAKIWDPATGRERGTLEGHDGVIWLATWSPDGRSVLTGSADGTAKIWDVATGRERGTVHGNEGEVDEAAWSPDGRRVLVVASGPTAQICDAPAAQACMTLHISTGFFTGGTWSPDGRFVVTTSDDIINQVGNTAQIWDATTGQQRAMLRGHQAGVSGAAWSGDGQAIVTFSQDTTAKIWDAGTGQERATLRGHSSWLVQAAWSPDSRFIVTASRDGTAKVWDATTGEERATLRGHGNVVNMGMWSPDGRLIVTASDDGSAKVWDGATGQLRATLAGHTGRVTSAAWSPDGRTVVTASRDDASARQYLIAIPDLLSLAATRVTRTMTAAERTTYLGEWDLVSRGEQLALRGTISAALSLYTQAQHEGQPISAANWNSLCWYGSLWAHAPEVHEACEQAVALAAPEDAANYRDSRAVNRALRADYAGALADEQAFVEWALTHYVRPELIEKRRGWIQELTAGRNPITPEVLEALRQNPSEEPEVPPSPSP